MKIVLLLFFILLYIVRLSATKGENNTVDTEDLFVPISESKIVKKGQKIPRGLHVRINLETGLTEARLMEEEKREKSSAVVEIPTEDLAPNPNSNDKLHFVEAKLKEALKNIKNEDTSFKDKKENTKNKFRSVEELKADLGDLNLIPKTDFEVLKGLMEQYQQIALDKNNNETNKLLVLEDLEYLVVHQYDNANEFVNLNGFKNIIYANLNSTNVNVKLETLKLLGSSVQNNAQAQIHAVETGAIGTLLRVLVLNTDYNVKSRAIFALSCVLRHFPLAQLNFINNVGLTVFDELLDSSDNIKLNLKIITLVHDLILVHEFVLKDTDAENLEKIVQYDQVNLKKKLDEHNWCQKLSNLLIDIIKTDLIDHDAIEKCLNAINSVINMCKGDSNRDLKASLSQLQSYYRSLITLEDDNYYSDLLNLCNKILILLNSKFKTEL